MSKLLSQLFNLSKILCYKGFLFVGLFLLTLPCLEATYIQVYSTVDNGALSWTGNTLGLNKASDQNNPGTSGSIGAFITLDTTSQVGSFPLGTTLNFANNSSAAVLDIPTGSTILHAELIWSGSYGFDAAVTLPVAITTPITFITPDSVSHTISPNPATTQSRTTTDNVQGGFYVTSSDVTPLVTAGGTYTVGGVPGTAAAAANNSNCAGWTLAVAYRNASMLTSNLTLFVGCEASGAEPALVSGFEAPTTGTISSRIFCSALEGDPQITGDQFLIGPNNPPTDVMSGTNNPVNNFFASQVNTLLPLTINVSNGKLIASGSSQLDTRGTFGTLNSIASSGTAISGARQGYDITSVDAGSSITNGQTQLYTQGTTTGDVYTINALGIQIQVSAPIISVTKLGNQSIVSLNDVITYTITLTNVGDATGDDLVFTDPLPTGLTLVPASFTVNSAHVLNPDLNAGVPLGGLGVNQTFTVQFQAQVTAINPPTSYSNTSFVAYSFTPSGSGTPISLTAQSAPLDIPANTSPPPVAVNDSGTTNANTLFNGPSVLTNDTGSNIQVSVYDNPSVHGGTVQMQTDGIYTYMPPLNFSGTDSFTYTIIDDQERTSTATVTMTVLPVAVNDSATVAANTPLNQSQSVLGNDAGSGLSVTTTTTTSEHGGTVTMSPNGTYTYTPPLNFSGDDRFSYSVIDTSGQTASAYVNITVLPVAENDTGTTPANTVLNGSTVFTNDIGTGLTLVAYDHTSVDGGTVVMNMMTGTYTYTPPPGFSGIDSFTYTVQDQQGDQSIATVMITVLPVAFKDTGTTTTNVPLNQLTSVLSNDLGTGLSITNYDTTSVNGGTVVMQPNGLYLYTPPQNYSGLDAFNYIATDSNGNSTTAKVNITVDPQASNDTAVTTANTTLIGPSVLINDEGTALQITSYQNPSANGGLVSMNVNGTYTYAPPLNFSGIDTFNYTATDSSGDPTTAIVTITVFPKAGNDQETTNANSSLNGPNLLGLSAGTGLSITSYQNPSSQGGTVTINPNGTYLYNPPANFSGTDTFTYTVTDSTGNSSTGLVTITVLPLAANDQVTTNANTPLNGPNLLALSAGTGLSITVYQNPSSQGGSVIINPDGTFLYNPPANFSGTDTFTYTITDSTGNSSTGLVTITVLPIAVNVITKTTENTRLRGQSVLTDAIGTGLQVTGYQSTTAEGGSVVMLPNGTFTYDPPKNFTGSDSFTFIITDSSGNTTQGTVTIRVKPVGPPRDFNGVIKKCKLLNKTTLHLETHWKKSSTTGIVFYRIYYDGKIIAKISAKNEFVFKSCLKSKNDAQKYSISAVNAGGAESVRIKLRIKND